MPETESETFETPEDEEKRLEKLREFDILDTEEDPSLDNITELVSKIFDVPMAMICLIDEDRQWFKSRVGLDFRETDRGCAFCNHTLLNRDVTVIPDTKKDDRLDGNPLVYDEPYLRAYAGAPLKTEDGYVIGTLCVLDTEPRQFTDVEIEILNGLAQEVMNQIELRYKNDRRRSLNNKLQEELKNLKQQVQVKESEKDELIHRVRNNLSQVKSFLKMQRTSDELTEDYHALDLAETKIHAIIVLYEQLHLTREKDTISIKSYLENIIQNVKSVFEDEVSEVECKKSIDDVEIPSELGMKFGIALNELMSNTYRHVFINGRGTTLNVDFKQIDGRCVLTVQDDGPGLPDKKDWKTNPRSGLNLIRRLVAHSEHGNFEYEDRDGAHFTITISQEATLD